MPEVKSNFTPSSVRLILEKMGFEMTPLPVPHVVHANDRAIQRRGERLHVCGHVGRGLEDADPVVPPAPADHVVSLGPFQVVGSGRAGDRAMRSRAGRRRHGEDGSRHHDDAENRPVRSPREQARRC